MNDNQVCHNINQIKEYPKEVNNLKYIINIINEMSSIHNNLKNSIDIEIKNLEIFYEDLIQISKKFMNDVSSLGNNLSDFLCYNSDNSGLINISMNLGCLF